MTQGVELNDFLQPCLEGKNVGVMSEAGVPCVADPGHKAARRHINFATTLDEREST